MKKLSKKRKDLIEQFAREEIHEAAVEVMKTEGYDGLTMQKVAEKAGVATGTLYNYFKNKDDLLIYIDNQICDQIRYELQDIVELDLPAAKKLNALIYSIYEFAEKNMAIFAILEQAQICHKIPKDEFNRRRERLMKVFKHIVSEGIDKNEFRKVDPTVAAELFKAATVGLIISKSELGTFDPVNDPANLLEMLHLYLNCETNQTKD